MSPNSVQGQEVRRLNQVRTHQEAMFLSDIAVSGGGKIDSTYTVDWKESHEGKVGRHRSKVIFGTEHPTREEWTTWRRELGRIHSPSWALSLSLDSWKRKPHRVWRYYWYDRKTDKLLVITDHGVEVYRRPEGERRKYQRDDTITRDQVLGKPASVTEEEDRLLKVQETGPLMEAEQAEDEESFF